MAEPRVLICLGAQKAGTSWLYDYLAARSDCHLRRIKELHYFDTLAKSADNPFQRGQRARLERLRARLAEGTAKRPRRDRAAIRDLEEYLPLVDAARPGGDHQAYLDYMTKGAGNARLVADISPSYANLPRPRLREMAALPADTRFLLLLRDPVARAWSQMRMGGSRRAPRDPARAQAVAFEMLEAFLQGGEPTVQARSDYAGMLKRLDAVLPADRLRVQFFEDLFSEAGVRDLCSFAGIDYVPAQTTRVVHASQNVPLPEEERGRLAAALAPHYAACAARFGDALPTAWRANMMETV